MAAQDNSGTPTPTPTSVIASEFIRAYYNALSNEPSALYAFYEDDSKFSRFEEGQVTDATPAQGQLAIHESVQSIPYAGCKVRIETTDSHDSAFGCVIVIVTGIIVLVGQPPRTFVQTFLLQPLVSGSPHFYVRNDILRYTSKITPPTAATPTPAPASSNHLPVPEQQHAPRPSSPVATPASAPSSPKKQPIAAPASPQPVAPKSPVKKAEEPVATPEPIVAPKSPQRAPEPPPAAASPTPEEQPAAAPAEKPQRVRKDRPKREKPAAAAPAAAAPAAETPAQAAAAPAEAKQEQKAPAKVAEKPKAVAKPAPVQPPRPTTWASRLFNAAKDGPLGIAKLATGTDVEPLETAPIDTAHINGENAGAAAAPTATNTETDQAARKPRSNKRPPSRTGKSGDAPTEKRERDPLYSLWVNNIPPQTTQPELNTLFGQYGNMRPIRLVAGKTYCFVDYYDVPSLENALRARPIKIHGVELSVDKKQMKQTPRPTSATSTTSKSTSTATPTTTEDDDGFQKSTAGRSRAYKQRVASENKAAAAQQQQAQQTSGPRPASGAKKPTSTNGAPRK